MDANREVLAKLCALEQEVRELAKDVQWLEGELHNLGRAVEALSALVAAGADTEASGRP